MNKLDTLEKWAAGKLLALEMDKSMAFELTESSLNGAVRAVGYHNQKQLLLDLLNQIKELKNG
jgi:hypothetical protein